MNASGFSLRKVVNGTTLASAAGITDVDASPDGERLVYTAASASGFRIVTIDRAGEQVDTFDARHRAIRTGFASRPTTTAW